MNAPSEPEPTTQHDGSPTAGTPDLTKHDAPAGDATTRLPLGPQGRPAGPGAAGPPPGQGAPPPGHGGPPPGPAPQGFPPPGFSSPGFAPPGPAPQGFAPQGFAPPGQSPVPYPGPGYGGPGGPATGPYSPLVGRPLTSDERTWGMLAHLGAIFFGFLAPLVILLVKGPESRFTRDQAVESLNFQITVAIAYVVSAILVLLLIGIVLILVVAVAHLVLSILGALAANKGEAYRYPVAIRLVT